MKKTILFVFLMCLVVSTGCAAKKHAQVHDYVDLPPETEVSSEVKIDFIEMHNVVLDNMMKDYTPFFFIKENCFDISGENDPKKIIITVDCLEGTKKEDIDLFLSYVLIEIGKNASEQNYKYKMPTQDNDGTYTSFGTVFDDYDLVLDIKVNGKEVLYDTTIKRGEKIPTNPRYWSE